jgi:hypothetical protein
MATVIDVTEAAQEMVRLCQEVTESGLLEQVQHVVSTADAYLRRAHHAVRDLQPPPEHARPPVASVEPDAVGIGRQLREHRTMIETAAKDAAELRRYVTDLEHLWKRLAA